MLATKPKLEPQKIQSASVNDEPANIVDKYYDPG